MSTLLEGFSREGVEALSADVFGKWVEWKRLDGYRTFDSVARLARTGDAEAIDILDRFEAHLVALTLTE